MANYRRISSWANIYRMDLGKIRRVDFEISISLAFYLELIIINQRISYRFFEFESEILEYKESLLKCFVANCWGTGRVCIVFLEINIKINCQGNMDWICTTNEITVPRADSLNGFLIGDQLHRKTTGIMELERRRNRDKIPRAKCWSGRFSI